MMTDRLQILRTMLESANADVERIKTLICMEELSGSCACCHKVFEMLNPFNGLCMGCDFKINGDEDVRVYAEE